MVPCVAREYGHRVLGLIDQRLGDVARGFRQADFQPGAEGIEAVHQAEVDASVDREIGWRRHLLFARCVADRALETS